MNITNRQTAMKAGNLLYGTRQKAMKWWNPLSTEEKIVHYQKYEREFFTPANSFNTLTGREIERIYNSIKH